MRFLKLGLVALAAATSLGGAAQAAFVTIGTATENRIQTDTRWTRDNVYILSRVMIVDNGAVLTIEPGTIIRAVTSNMSGYNSEPGALLVARGGKIVANGTADDVIVMTSIDDPNVLGGLNTVPDTFVAQGVTSVTVEANRWVTFATGTPGTFTAEVSADVPALNDTVILGTAVAPLTAGTTYHVVNPNPGSRTFQLAATSGGTALNITATSGNTRITTVNGVALTEDINENRLDGPFPMVSGTPLTFAGTTTLPGGIVSATATYFVVSPATFGGRNKFSVATTVGGPAIDITSAGSGVKVSAAAAFTLKGAGRSVLVTENDYTADGPEGDNAFSKASRWGGVVICGNARVAQGTSSTDTTPADGIWDSHDTSIVQATAQNNGTGTDFVEGLSDASGSDLLNSTLAIYGGTNDNDNSGVMRFVSMRYGGFVVGAAAAGNEINGLTVCGAGTGTTLEFLEVFQNRDDGFEWFGGKHDTRFLFSISNQDDSFDGDEGYRGKAQFWTAIQGTQNASPAASLRSGYFFNEPIGQDETASDYRYDRLLEWDGGEANDGDRLPLTDLDVYNATLLAGATQKRGIIARLEAQIGVYNSIIENATAMSEANQSATLGTHTSLLTVSNIHSFNTTTTGAAELGTVTSSTVTVLSQIAPTFAEETASQIASAWSNTGSDLYTKNGLDPRLAAGAAARSEDGTQFGAGMVVAGYAGSMLDNNQLAGWSILEALEVLPTTNVARPVLTINVTGANPVISFPSAGAAIKYVFEKSTDGRNWTVLTPTPVTNPTTVSHTDTTTTTGTIVHYRAYAL